MGPVRYGLRAVSARSPKSKEAWPWYLSEPGFVRTSTRPNPTRSYSAENGFWLTRISRMDAFGGMTPSLKPSMKICAPSGPADRTREHLQFIGQIFGIVRKRIQIVAPEDDLPDILRGID